MRKHLTLILLIAVSLGFIGYALRQRALKPATAAETRRILYYQDSMHPWVKADRPGKCPICAMTLMPVHEGEKSAELGPDLVVLSPNNVTVLGVQSAPVTRQTLKRVLSVAGTLNENETRKAFVSSPAPGRIQTLAVDHIGAEVEEGQTLVTLFSPELQQKRLYFRSKAEKYQGPSNDLAQAKYDPYSNDLVTPQSGVVVERKAYLGQYVTEGDPLFTIVDASVLWFRFDVYERQLPWLEVGQSLDLVVPAIPGKTFPAVISFIEPTLDEATRTVRVRADVQNPVETNGHKQRVLKFGMFAEGRVHADIPEVLTVPRTAILFPGDAAYAYVDQGDGLYKRQRVKLGRQGDDLWEVLSGLKEGDRVVTAGNVLLDAQAQLAQGDPTDTPRVYETPPAEPAGSPAPENDAPPPTPGPTPGVGDEPAATQSGPSAKEPARTSMNRARLDRVQGRMAMRDELWLKRIDAITEARAKEAAQTNGFSVSQRLALNAFVSLAADAGAALAGGDLVRFNQFVARLPGALAVVQTEQAAMTHLSPLIQSLTDLRQVAAPRDLAEARARFLPFSTAMAGLVRDIREKDPAWAGLKIYHCPKAPAPGLWIQAKGPMANPFFDAKQDSCGEEVGP